MGVGVGGAHSSCSHQVAAPCSSLFPGESVHVSALRELVPFWSSQILMGPPTLLWGEAGAFSSTSLSPPGL